MKRLALIRGRGWVTSVGIYVIIVLALLRFLVYPLRAAVKDRESALADQYDTYALKSRMLEKTYHDHEGEKTSRDLERLRFSLYARSEQTSKIQAEVLASLSALSEAKGMTVTGFEMPEALAGKKITEVPVVIRLKGRAEAFVELLKTLEKQEKILLVRAVEASATGQDMTISLTVKALRRG